MFQLDLEKLKNEHKKQVEQWRQNQAKKPPEKIYMNAKMPHLQIFDDEKDKIIFLKDFRGVPRHIPVSGTHQTVSSPLVHW